MKVNFRPNPYGGWYYSIIDDNGKEHSSYYVLCSYKAAVRKARRKAKSLNKTVGLKRHTLDLETGAVNYTDPYQSLYKAAYSKSKPDCDSDTVLWVKATGMREDGRVSIRLSDVKDYLDELA